jgi:hypothetical protein
MRPSRTTALSSVRLESTPGELSDLSSREGTEEEKKPRNSTRLDGKNEKCLFDCKNYSGIGLIIAEGTRRLAF